MKKHTTRNSLLLLLTAFIWGLAFVAQSEGGKQVGPYTFNTIRSYIGALVLLPVILTLDKMGLSKKPSNKEERKVLWTGGIACGISLGIATNLQQVGMYLGASAGKAGFLTACYIVLVPILGMFIGKKCSPFVWVSVGIAIAGLYLLCINGAESFGLALGDVLVLTCALVFAIQILLVDHYSPKVDGVRLSAIQFTICALISTVLMVSKEFGTTSEQIHVWVSNLSSLNAWIPILYAGVLSCGVAYTLQIIGQRDVPPTAASLIMSLESVFSVIGAWVILKQSMTGRQLIGCGLIFLAIVICQVVPAKE